MNRRIWLLVLVMTVVVFGGLLPTLAEAVFTLLLKRLYPEWTTWAASTRTLLTIAAFVIVAGLVIYAITTMTRMGHALLETRARIYPVGDAAAARPFLVMGLSPLSEGNRDLADTARALSFEQMAFNTGAFEALAANLDAAGVAGSAAKTLGRRFPWQQNFRAAWPHRGVLTKIVVIPSTESAADFSAFLQLFSDKLWHMTGRDIPVVAEPAAGVDYEDYEALRDVFETVLDDMAKDDRAQPEQICIDLTAGQKPFSLVAAIMTLNRRYHFSYVGTNTGEARSYDAEAQLPSLIDG